MKTEKLLRRWLFSLVVGVLAVLLLETAAWYLARGDAWVRIAPMP